MVLVNCREERAVYISSGQLHVATCIYSVVGDHNTVEKVTYLNTLGPEGVQITELFKVNFYTAKYF